MNRPFATASHRFFSAAFFAATFAALAVLAAACAPHAGPRIRIATASAADLDAAKDKDEVWYEFQAGDVVPLKIAFVGAVQGGAPAEGAVLRAKRTLYFVMKKNQPMEISFDGKSFASAESSKFVVLVAPRKDGAGGELGWIIYLGENGNLKEAIEAEIKEAHEEAPKK